MIICREKHDEIVYDDTKRDDAGYLKFCPLCIAIGEIAELQRYAAKLHEDREQ